MSEFRIATEATEFRWILAVEWHALRCGKAGLTPAQGAAWRLWWHDAENRRVYRACARLHADAQLFQSRDRMVPAAGGRASVSSPGRGRRAMRLVLATAGVGALLCLSPQTQRARPISRSAALARQVAYETARGQTQRVTLRDGSTVILGGATALTVTLSAQRRTVNLERGEAWFHVVHRRDWPFSVEAGSGTITDLGTAFVVDREADRVEVTVTEGLVEVAIDRLTRVQPVKRVTRPPIRLHRGERFTYGKDAHGVVRQVNPRAALGWTLGELEFSNEPLSEVIANVNRYTRHPIAVSPAAGRLRLTTLVLSRRIHEWLGGLSRVLPVTVVQHNAALCVQLRAAQVTHLSNDCGGR